MNNLKKVNLCVGLVIISWASTPAVAKLVLKGFNSMQMLFFTTLIASATLFVIAVLQNKVKFISEYRMNDYLTFAYMGGLGVFFYYLFFFGSLKLISAQTANTINYLWPAWIIIFAALILKERFTLTKIVSLFLAFFGVCFVLFKGNILGLNFSNGLGVLWAFLAAVSYGLFSVLGKKLHYEIVTSMMFYYFFSFVFVTIVLLIFPLQIKIPNLYQMVGLLWIGIVPNGMAYSLWFFALKYGETSKVSMMSYLTPFLAMVFISILAGEKILLSSVVGLFIIILGISLQFLKVR